MYHLQLLTDDKYHGYCMTMKFQYRRKLRMSEFLNRFDYYIVYLPVKSNWYVDALTRRPGDLPEGRDERLKNMEQVVLKPQNLPEQLNLLAVCLHTQGRPSILDVKMEAYMRDR